jgi:hypothetical protein
MRKGLKIAAGVMLAGCAMGAGSAHAFVPSNITVLTFDGNICNGGQTCGNGSQIDQSYGDSATVDVQYNASVSALTASSGALPALADHSGQNLYFWTDQYNELTNVAYGNNGAEAEIFLAPTAGNSVTLNSFDLGAWPQTTRNSQVTIVDGLGNTLFSSGAITIGTGNHSNHFDLNLTSTTGIGIEFGPDAYNVGIDNLSFTTNAISGAPEPSSWGMMLLGFGLAGGALRRRKAIPALRTA